MDENEFPFLVLLEVLIQFQRKSDQDDYTVKVYPKGFILSQKAYITVEGIALKLQNLTYQTAIEGDQVQIPILVNGGTGKYLYSWYKNNELIKSTNYPYYIMSSVSKQKKVLSRYYF